MRADIEWYKRENIGTVDLSRLIENLTFVERPKGHTPQTRILGQWSRGGNAVLIFASGGDIFSGPTQSCSIGSRSGGVPTNSAILCETDRTKVQCRALEGETRLNSNDTRWIDPRNLLFTIDSPTIYILSCFNKRKRPVGWYFFLRTFSLGKQILYKCLSTLNREKHFHVFFATHSMSRSNLKSYQLCIIQTRYDENYGKQLRSNSPVATKIVAGNDFPPLVFISVESIDR